VYVFFFLSADRELSCLWQYVNSSRYYQLKWTTLFRGLW